MSDLIGVVCTGGKQYQFIKGKIYYVDRLKAQPGDVIDFPQILMILDKDKCYTASQQQSLTNWQITARVQGEVKSDKIKVVKFKKRKNYRRSFGHRQIYSQILILDIKQHSEQKSLSSKNTD